MVRYTFLKNVRYIRYTFLKNVRCIRYTFFKKTSIYRAPVDGPWASICASLLFFYLAPKLTFFILGAKTYFLLIGIINIRPYYPPGGGILSVTHF